MVMMINDETIRMISEQSIQSFLFLLLLSLHFVFIQSFDPSSCTPKKLILLSNCTFRQLNTSLSSSSFVFIDNKTLSITVPHLYDDENNPIEIVRRRTSTMPIIRLNLSLIQCSINRSWNWSSVEASSTLRGEFIRTTLVEPNQMYLSSGVTHLRNLTSIDCKKKILYRTSNDEIFRIDFKIESTLNDSCSDDRPCFPSDIYQCHHEEQRCVCRQPFESYLTKDHQSICIHAVQTFDQCRYDLQRCVPWCNQNSSMNRCLCPEKISTMKIRSDNRVFCESQRNGMCHSLLQCPADDQCIDGLCQNVHHRWKMREYLSWNLLVISIVISSGILAVIILLLSISLCLLRRRQRRKETSHSSLDSVYKNKDEEAIIQSPTIKNGETTMTTATTSDYDNIIYGIFRQNVHLSRTNENKHERSSTPYNPKVVYLGGEQQLTAIYA